MRIGILGVVLQLVEGSVFVFELVGCLDSRMVLKVLPDPRKIYELLDARFREDGFVSDAYKSRCQLIGNTDENVTVWGTM